MNGRKPNPFHRGFDLKQHKFSYDFFRLDFKESLTVKVLSKSVPEHIKTLSVFYQHFGVASVLEL